jgi:O-antigen/teichoic acid export membrane protein
MSNAEPIIVEAVPRSDSTRKHIRGSSLLLAGRLIAMAVNFAVQVLIVRYLSKTEYGAFAYAMSVISMTTSLAIFGLDKATSRYVPIYEEQKDYRKMFGTMFIAGGSILGIGTSIVLIVFGLRGYLSQQVVSDPLSLAILLIVIGLTPLSALNSFFEDVLAIFARPGMIFFRRHILSPAFKLGAVLFVILTHTNVYVLASAHVVTGIAGFIIYIALVFKVFRERGLLSHFHLRSIELPFREIFLFSFPLLATDAALILRSSMVVMLLEYLKNPESVAEFRAVDPVAGLTLIVMQSFKFLFVPMAARMFVKNDRAGINDLYWKTAIWISVISFPIFVVCFSLAEPLTVLLFGARYQQSGVILAILAFGNYFNAALGLNAYTLRVYGKVRFIVVNDLLAALLSLVLSLLLIPQFGALGAAIGTASTIVIHNLLNHAGLQFGVGIDLFQWRYIKIYLSILLSTAGLLLIQELLNPPLWVGGILVGIVSVGLIRLSRRVLDIEHMFPELLRIPILRSLLRV